VSEVLYDLTQAGRRPSKKDVELSEHAVPVGVTPPAELGVSQRKKEKIEDSIVVS
jgi:hypothetical protein